MRPRETLRVLDRSRLVRSACLTLGAWLVLASCPLLPASEAAREWRGQIVDAETGHPLDGVIVLVYWVRYTPSLGGWAGGKYVGSVEVVTDADGRFAIPLRRTYTIPLVTKVDGPEVVMFKPGYGRWRTALGPDERDKGIDDRIELPPVKSFDARRKFYSEIFIAPVLPRDRWPRLQAALEAERLYIISREK